ncbi:MAG: SDR family oxidoreductase [Ginsengibacter sp.]
MNIVITGSGKGIGKGLAEKFSARGNQVFICSRTEEDLLKIIQEINKRKPGAVIKYLVVDLSIKNEVLRFTDWIVAQGVTVDILINNAGQFIPGSVYNEEEGTLEKMIEVNLYSAYHITRALLPEMMKKKRGHIFNICSIASLKAYHNGGAYSISKFAMMGFSKNLREEMKPYNIKVTSVYPGATLTPTWEGADLDPGRILEVSDIVEMIYAASQLSPQACVEDLIIRPQLGDLP